MNSSGNDALAGNLRATSDRVEALVDTVSEMSASILMLRKDMSRVLTIVRGADESSGLVVRQSHIEDSLAALADRMDTADSAYDQYVLQHRRSELTRLRGAWAVLAAAVGAAVAAALSVFGGGR